MSKAPHSFDFIAGEVLLIDKPLKWTSFDAVNRIKHLLKKNLGQKIKVGHAGTLDPLATGLLIICTGKKTKEIETYQAQEKEYTGTFIIGATTPCYDLEQPVDRTFQVAHITDDMIHSATHAFIGDIQQVPPLFSAVKVEGKRAYDIARAGKERELGARSITIRAFEITGIERKDDTIEAQFKVICSKGTYIRSLARDFGEALHSGAHLGALRRTAIGSFRVDSAMSIEAISNIILSTDKEISQNT